MSKFKTSTILLSLSIFFTGASGLIAEYLLSTISIYILGNSIEQFSITIAIMLVIHIKCRECPDCRGSAGGRFCEIS